MVAVGKVRMSRPWSAGEVLVDFSSSCPVDRGYFVLFIVARSDMRFMENEKDLNFGFL